MENNKRCKTCSKPINKRDALYNFVSCGESMHMTTNCTDLEENAINVLKQLNKIVLLLCNIVWEITRRMQLLILTYE